MTTKRALRATTLLLTAAVAAGALAACGSSSSGSTTASAAASSSSSSSRAKLQTCLKQHGVTLPAGFGKGRPGSGGNGAPPAGGGTPPSSGSNGNGPPKGGFGGSANSARLQKMRAALKACGANFGGVGGGGPGRGGFTPSTAAIAKFSACVKQHGYTLPKANTSGNGPIYPRTIESNKKFQSASKACTSDLRPSGGGSSGSSSGSSD